MPPLMTIICGDAGCCEYSLSSVSCAHYVFKACFYFAEAERNRTQIKKQIKFYIQKQILTFKLRPRVNGRRETFENQTRASVKASKSVYRTDPFSEISQSSRKTRPSTPLATPKYF